MSPAHEIPGRPPSSAINPSLRRAALALLSFAASLLLAVSCFFFHFNLSTAGSLELLLVVLIALRWGFTQATVASIAGVLCLNYFFTLPLFQLSVADPKNWISLITFEVTALLVSGLADKVRLHAAAAELERSRNARLYELSRAILLIDTRTSTITQLSTLIQDLLEVRAVHLWLLQDVDPIPAQSPAANPAQQAFLTNLDTDDPETATRILRVGLTPIGAISLAGWRSDPALADSVASLIAVAVERARAIHKENRAEAQRNTEQLRTAVLDGLAHGFKTPLTAIQTASSGLLALNQLNPTQAELVTIIDEEATLLARMTTRLLKTAALETSEVRLNLTTLPLISLVEEVIAQQDPHTQTRIQTRIHITPTASIDVHVDPQLMELALAQLIDNAAKYSPVDSPIVIALLQSATETLITVTNEGSPIRPEERDRIFDRFYRGIASSQGPTGTGLGLSIVRKTAQAHNGRVWVDCEADQTRFSFAIPNTPDPRRTS